MTARRIWAAALIVCGLGFLYALNGMVMCMSFSGGPNPERWIRAFWYWLALAAFFFGSSIVTLAKLWRIFPWNKTYAHANLDMNEVSAILREQEKEAKKLPYSNFESWIREEKVEVFQITSQTGLVYEIEREAWVDDEAIKSIRVVIRLHLHGDRSVYSPKSADFIVAPDGSFIGE